MKYLNQLVTRNNVFLVAKVIIKKIQWSQEKSQAEPRITSYGSYNHTKADRYVELTRTSKIELFAKIEAFCFQPLTIFCRCSILDT